MRTFAPQIFPRGFILLITAIGLNSGTHYKQGCGESGSNSQLLKNGWRIAHAEGQSVATYREASVIEESNQLLLVDTVGRTGQSTDRQAERAVCAGDRGTAG